LGSGRQVPADLKQFPRGSGRTPVQFRQTISGWFQNWFPESVQNKFLGPGDVLCGYAGSDNIKKWPSVFTEGRREHSTELSEAGVY